MQDTKEKITKQKLGTENRYSSEVTEVVKGPRSQAVAGERVYGRYIDIIDDISCIEASLSTIAAVIPEACVDRTMQSLPVGNVQWRIQRACSL